MQNSNRARASATEIAMDRIKQYILVNQLRPGDPIPTESELCMTLGVSRSSVREAVRTLSALDIIDVRHGIGTFVGQLSLKSLVDGMVFRGVLSPGSEFEALREVVEVRTALDLSIAETIVEVMADTSADDLAALVNEMESLAAAGKSFADQDRAFHTLLVGRLNNSLMAQLVAAFWDIHTTVLPHLGVATPSDISQTVHAHRAMLDAALSGDASVYRQAVLDHYAPLLNVLQQTVSSLSAPQNAAS